MTAALIGTRANFNMVACNMQQLQDLTGQTIQYSVCSLLSIFVCASRVSGAQSDYLAPMHGSLPQHQTPDATDSLV